MNDNASPRTLRITGMDCGSCAVTIQNALRQLDGVREAEVSFPTETLTVTGTVSDEALRARVEALGYKLESAPSEAAGSSPAQSPWAYLGARPYTCAVLSGGAAALCGYALARGGDLAWLAELALVGVAVAAGAPVALKGVRALMYGRQVTIDLLMVVAAAGAAAIGDSVEAVAVLTLYLLGETLEGYSSARARQSVSQLMTLAPDEATLLDGPGGATLASHDGRTGCCQPAAGSPGRRVPTATLQVGQRILVRPGERVPVDGRVLAGTSQVNEAPLTGESRPVDKGPGAALLAGTINGEGALEVEVTRPAADSAVQRVARLVAQAQRERAPAERLIDRFARVYTPLVVGLAACVASLPPLLFGEPFLGTQHGEGWLYRGLTLLIVACPCALVISIPVTVVSALAGLSRVGALVKGGAYLDRLASVRVFAFDKTGTLTRGRPTVTGARGLACSEADDARCESCDEVVALASAVEQHSAHPLAHAILSEAAGRAVGERYGRARGVTSLTGAGVQGEVHTGTVVIGSHAMHHERGNAACQLHDEIQAAESQGDTVMLVTHNGEMKGYIAAQDALRPESRQALSALRRLGLRLAMLTGDHPQAAQAVAERLGVLDEVHAGLLPQDKLRLIRALRQRYGGVAMVGDGVNDTPALASADLGVALGAAGSGQAMETADVVLMGDDLLALPRLVQVARKTRRVLRENIALSLGLKAVFLGLAAAGVATLWMAVVADVGATLLVTLNGLRMLRPLPRSTLSFSPAGAPDRPA